jgi:putative ABC transport system permease protein
MLHSYLIVAIRNLIRSPGYAAINVLGLAVGLAVVLLIGIYVQREFSFDRHYPDAENIYQVLRETIQKDGKPTTTVGLSGGLVPEIRASIPDVESALRVAYLDVWAIKDEVRFRQTVALTEPPFFTFFGVEAIAGSPSDLQGPRDILITESIARKFFGRTDVVGETIDLENRYASGTYAVRAVLQDPPGKTTLQYGFVVYAASINEEFWRWREWIRHGWSEVSVYLRPREGASIVAITQKLHDAMRANLGDEIADGNRYHLQPITRKYLYSKADYGINVDSFNVQGLTYGDIEAVRMSALVAGFILLIACVNFTNLATARSIRRTQEVGLRKVMGAHRRQLMGQFLGEAILVSLLAALVSIGLAFVGLPAFNSLVERELALSSDPVLALQLLGAAVLSGLIAGVYPAFVLSRSRPALAVKGAGAMSGRAGWTRKGLVVSQFAITIALIVSTLVVRRQLDYIGSKDLGFDRDQIVLMPIFWNAKNAKGTGNNGIDLKSRFQEVKAACLAHPDVLKAGTSRFYLQDYAAQYDVAPEGSATPTTVRVISIDDTYLETMGIGLLAGRTFTAEYAEQNDYNRKEAGKSGQLIINAASAARFGWTPEEALGKRIQWHNSRWPYDTVIGVTEDFHVRTLRDPIEPAMFDISHWNMKLIQAKVRGDRIPEALAHLKSVWERYLPSRPFDYQFLDDKIDSYYRAEQKQAEVFQRFATLAILVACLGLFGLAAFTAAQRTKEISIRKVVGASESGLVMMLSGEFTRLVLVANLIAWPVAWWAMDAWLASFEFRVALGPGVFVGSGLLALMIALVTAGYQAWRAAKADPVVAIRVE